MSKIFEEGYKSIDDGLFVKVEGYSDRIFKIMRHLWWQTFNVVDYMGDKPHIVADDGDTKQCQKHYQDKGYTTKLIDDYIGYTLLDIIQEQLIVINVHPTNPEKITTKLTLEESKLVLEYKRNQNLIAKDIILKKQTGILARMYDLNLPIS